MICMLFYFIFSGRLKIIFLENYRVSLAEKVIPVSASFERRLLSLSLSFSLLSLSLSLTSLRASFVLLSLSSLSPSSCVAPAVLRPRLTLHWLSIRHDTTKWSDWRWEPSRVAKVRCCVTCIPDEIHIWNHLRHHSRLKMDSEISFSQLFKRHQLSTPCCPELSVHFNGRHHVWALCFTNWSKPK